MLRDLSDQQLSDVFQRCIAIESLYRTGPNGETLRHIGVTDEHLAQQRLELLDVLDGISDEGIKELLALMWFGRGEMSSYADSINYARTAFDAQSRDYLASKAPLRAYVEQGISMMRDGVTVGDEDSDEYQE